MKTIDAYKKILKVVEGCAKEVKLDINVNISYQLKQLISREEIQESFGIDLTMSYGSTDTYYRVDEGQFIAKYGNKYSRTISWSDDRRQPEDEWLFVISYPTGAYIFGEDYQQDTFKQYFEELKSFEPKYVDTANSNLYYTAEKAKAVYEKVDEIYKKYKAIAEDNRKESKIEALKKQLEELEA